MTILFCYIFALSEYLSPVGFSLCTYPNGGPGVCLAAQLYLIDPISVPQPVTENNRGITTCSHIHQCVLPLVAAPPYLLVRITQCSFHMKVMTW